MLFYLEFWSGGGEQTEAVSPYKESMTEGVIIRLLVKALIRFP